jgi:hypothetical protein
VLAIFLLSLSAANVPSCHLIQARYTLRGAPEVTASFEARTPTQFWPEDVVMSVRSAKTPDTYKFLPALEGSGLGVKSHLETLGAHGEIISNEPSPLGLDNMFLVATANYSFDQRWAPSRMAAAPAHILVPGLQELFWYSDLQHRDAVPVAFLDLTSCGS